MFDNREIIEFFDVVTYFAEKQYQNDEEKNEFFNSFISRVVLFDDCVYIFYNTSPNTPTKVKLDKSDLTALREYRTNRKSTLFEPIKFKLGAFGGQVVIAFELFLLLLSYRQWSIFQYLYHRVY